MQNSIIAFLASPSLNYCIPEAAFSVGQSSLSRLSPVFCRVLSLLQTSDKTVPSGDKSYKESSREKLDSAASTSKARRLMKDQNVVLPFSSR